MEIAVSVQERVRSDLQQSNNRAVKRGDDIYLLENLSNPAVLIECGFLSNEKELASLKDKDYQKLLALNLFASLIEHGN